MISRNDLSLWKVIGESLKNEPAYLLVFALVLVISTVGGILGGSWLGVSLIGICTIAAEALVLVERNRVGVLERLKDTEARAMFADSPEEKRTILFLKSEADSIRDVFEGMVNNDEDVYLVYSRHEVDRFVDHEGQLIPFPFDGTKDVLRLLLTLRALRRCKVCCISLARNGAYTL